MAEKLSVKIYNDIKKKIEDGEIDLREFLSEAKVAEQYGVSKAPVRDALHLLTDQGYLVSYHRKGYMVNTFSIDELNQIQAIRKQIEKLSVELAVQNASDEEIDSLEQFCSDPEHANGRTNFDFHMGLARISGNKYLPEALEGFLSKLSIAQIPQKLDLEKHRRIIRALKDRDAARALACIDDDISFL